MGWSWWGVRFFLVNGGRGRRGLTPGGYDAGELLHYSIDKALDILGIGSANLVRIPVNEEYQIRTDLCELALEKARAEGKLVLCVIGLAGSTEAGCVVASSSLPRCADDGDEERAEFG